MSEREREREKKKKDRKKERTKERQKERETERKKGRKKKERKKVVSPVLRVEGVLDVEVVDAFGQDEVSLAPRYRDLS